MMDIEEAVRKVYPAVTEEKGGDELVVDCPECGHHKLYFHVADDEKYGVFRCWSCELRGSALYRKGQDLVLDGRRVQATPKVSREPHRPASKITEVMPDTLDGAGCMDLHVAAEEVPEEWGPVEAYLRSRLKPDEADIILADMDDVWGVQYVPRKNGKSFARGVFDTGGTLCFVVTNMVGKPVGWQCRVVGPDPRKLSVQEALERGYFVEGGKVRTPKTFSAPGWNKGWTLYGIDQVTAPVNAEDELGLLQDVGRLVALVEGPMDVHAVGPCAVSGLGCDLTVEQRTVVEALSAKGVLVLLMDGDEEGRKAQAQLERSALQSSPVSGSKYKPSVVLPVSLPDGVDPGEAGRRECWRRIVAAAKERGVDLKKYKFRVPEGVEDIVG